MITLEDFNVGYAQYLEEERYPVKYTAAQKRLWFIQISSCRYGWVWCVWEFGDDMDVKRERYFGTAQEALNDLLACNEPFVQRGLRAVFGIEPAEVGT